MAPGELATKFFRPERPPETLRGAVRLIITGVHKLDNRLMLVLDTAKACDMTADAVVAGQ
jgi:hypothetical protein